MKKPSIILLVFFWINTLYAQEPIQLIKHTVDSDGHPITVWEKGMDTNHPPILFVHGRTWSGVPDFDLQVEGEELSLMDGMIENGFFAYAIDLRGYGATPRDGSGWLSPNSAATDVAAVLEWIEKRHSKKAHLFGWSMGSTISLLAVNQYPDKMESLIVFGFWMDLDKKIPAVENGEPERKKNTAEAAASDFITPGSISQKAIDRYVEMALAADPIRVDLNKMDQYNAIDPSKIEIPVLILQGEFDPIGPTKYQTKLFTRLRTSHKAWVVIPGGDHAAFMETPRPYFINVFTQFLKNQ